VTHLEIASAIDYGTPHNQIAGTLPGAQGAVEYFNIRLRGREKMQDGIYGH